MLGADGALERRARAARLRARRSRRGRASDRRAPGRSPRPPEMDVGCVVACADRVVSVAVRGRRRAQTWSITSSPPSATMKSSPRGSLDDVLCDVPRITHGCDVPARSRARRADSAVRPSTCVGDAREPGHRPAACGCHVEVSRQAVADVHVRGIGGLEALADDRRAVRRPGREVVTPSDEAGRSGDDAPERSTICPPPNRESARVRRPARSGSKSSVAGHRSERPDPSVRARLRPQVRSRSRRRSTTSEAQRVFVRQLPLGARGDVDDPGAAAPRPV